MISVTPSTFRRSTRTVRVGNVLIGSEHPIRIQSMTTTPTHDVDATVEQILRLEQAGCEIVRVTVQGKKEAFACEEIKNRLVQNNVRIPLVADIHFYPPAALVVADFVDKIRINPGNYLDKRATFKLVEYTEEQYQQELERLEQNFFPLLEKCKKLGKPLRIGTNHGSLSDRIMNRFGDTPAGMVESALEYARICVKHGFEDLIFSMKASNPLVMIEAYRLLVQKLDQNKWLFPLHLGVTEAGMGLEGRIKSAVGMGALLAEGLGDTIRVSLTEDPVEEIVPCQILRTFAEMQKEKTQERSSFRMERRALSQDCKPIHPNGTLGIKPVQSVGSLPFSKKRKAAQADFWICQEEKQKERAKREGVSIQEQVTLIETKEQWPSLLAKNPPFVVLDPSADLCSFAREFARFQQVHALSIPTFLLQRICPSSLSSIMEISALAGSCFVDNVIDGIVLEGSDPDLLTEIGFMLLQAARRRSIKTEFISCPGCGRTLFDLQSVTKRIQEKTGHLPGVKIAVMGCIVNGPGEMADADFGYVGSGRNKVDLYIGKTCVRKGIDHEQADEALVELIKQEGKWVEASC
jgi:(E)-4-hydroxy-3-methylbut-2-enyl-diphosphate synthase